MKYYTKRAGQTLSYFNEQKLDIETCVKTIVLYVNILAQNELINFFGFEGFQEVGRHLPYSILLYTIQGKKLLQQH